MTNKTYDLLKWIAQYFLPALGTLYFALASIWGLSYGEQVLGTITAIDLFLGAILGISSNEYKKEIANAPSLGKLVVNNTDPLKDNVRIVLTDDLDSLGHKKYVTLQVENEGNQSQK